MTRIGLLTYHHVINIGSVLQTYATYCLLSRLYPNVDIEVIDYYPEDSQRYNAYQRKISPKNNFFSKKEWSSLEYCFSTFLRTHCKFSPFTLRTDCSDDANKAFKYRHYDAIVVGSDTVFQIDGYFGRQIAGPTAPNIYYLLGIDNPLKIGLSVSIDPFIPSSLNASLVTQLTAAIKDFTCIFFRDVTTKIFIKNLGYEENKMGFSPDPTIMVDIEHLVHRGYSTYKFDKIPVAVSIGNGAMRNKVSNYLKNRGYRVLDTLQPKTFLKNRIFRIPSISERLSIYRNLNGIVTDRYHGSILALKLGDYPVIGIEDSSRYTEQNSKLRDLYTRLNISHRLIRSNPESLDESLFWSVWENDSDSKTEIISRFEQLRSEGTRILTELMPTLHV